MAQLLTSIADDADGRRRVDENSLLEHGQLPEDEDVRTKELQELHVLYSYLGGQSGWGRGGRGEEREQL